jgi:hypothetical protein
MGEVACENCGGKLDPEARRCPACGAAVVALAAELPSSGGLTAVALKGGKDPFAVRTVSSAPGTRESTADVQDDGTISQLVEGPPPQGEAHTLEAAANVIARLNAGGAHWTNLRAASTPDADFEADDGPTVLRMQVVRAIANRDTWERLQREGRLEGRESAEALADALLEAVVHKQHRGGGLVLVLDATDLPALTMPTVVESFRERHFSAARNVGFDAVWLAGPVESLVSRLDVPSP